MSKLLSTLLLTSTIFTVNAANFNQFKPQLFLAGGSLKTCSSMAVKNCENQPQSGKQSLQFTISTQHIERFKNHWPKHYSPQSKQQLLKLLNKIAAKNKPQNLTKSELRKILRKFDQKKIIRAIPDREYYYLLDSLEIQVSQNGNRLTEQVSLKNSKNPFAIELYQQFVSYAAQISGKKQPKVLVMTASARDPFEAVDFYTQVFTQAGADTTWLPLDASLQAALKNKNCDQLNDYRLNIQGNAFRDSVYPKLAQYQLDMCQNRQKLTELIAQADGLFINGGDQSKTVQALKTPSGQDTNLMTQIRAKVEQGKLIVGGTSAGTAVQSKAVMISNGRSEVALVRGAKADVLPTEGCDKNNSCEQQIRQDDLTYRSAGGIGLFDLGVTDTHFSERGRQGRLAQLVLDTKVKFGFGVDETTALVVGKIADKHHLKVLGQSGVFIVEKQSKKSLLTHYLTNGDSAIIQDGNLTINFASNKVLVTSKNQKPSKLASHYDDVFDGLKYQQLAQLMCRTGEKSLNLSANWQNQTTKMALSKTNHAASAIGAVQHGKEIYGYCSYQNYLLDIK